MGDSKLHLGAGRELFNYARMNRRSLTATERILWNRLRDRRFKGLKFRRQHPILDYIADFYCMEHHLVIEIDGGYHLEREQSDYDKGRDNDLSGLGLKTLRFTNQEIEEDLDKVLHIIEKHLSQQKENNSTYF